MGDSVEGDKVGLWALSLGFGLFLLLHALLIAPLILNQNNILLKTNRYINLYSININKYIINKRCDVC